MRRSPPLAAVLIPVKDFRLAKARLAEALGEEERARLARSMATTVVESAHPLPTFVACDDDEVAEWARSVGAVPLTDVRPGLNPAVTDSVALLAERGIERVVIAHGDLPRARGLAALAEGDGVVLVPDRRLDGTNVMCVPTGAGFEFRYGPDSFRAHDEEARRLGLEVRVHLDEDLAWDVDVPDDLPVDRR